METGMTCSRRGWVALTTQAKAALPFLLRPFPPLWRPDEPSHSIFDLQCRDTWYVAGSTLAAESLWARLNWLSQDIPTGHAIVQPFRVERPKVFNYRYASYLAEKTCQTYKSYYHALSLSKHNDLPTALAYNLAVKSWSVTCKVESRSSWGIIELDLSHLQSVTKCHIESLNWMVRPDGTMIMAAGMLQCLSLNVLSTGSQQSTPPKALNSANTCCLGNLLQPEKKHGLKRGPDLTSHNELLVNGISGGAPFWIVGTVNINTQAWVSHSWTREYPIEKWPTKNKKALQHRKCNLFTLWVERRRSVNVTKWQTCYWTREGRHFLTWSVFQYCMQYKKNSF